MFIVKTFTSATQVDSNALLQITSQNTMHYGSEPEQY